ncbi:hypothetical protein [Saccharothrix sp. HUAS TT1]|uniref:hypothetical protein n=1 Tax=unclassified Saccharothrix TaxID=2593673 RepID=UPI00345C53E2
MTAATTTSAPAGTGAPTLLGLVAARFLIEDDVFEWGGRLWTADYAPPVHDGIAYVPISADGFADCLEIPAHRTVRLHDRPTPVA